MWRAGAEVLLAASLVIFTYTYLNLNRWHVRYSHLAIGWLASKPYVGSVIAGATKPEQVDSNVTAGDWKLTPEEMAAVDTIAS